MNRLKNRLRRKKCRLVMAILLTVVLGVCTEPSGWIFEKNGTGSKKICGKIWGEENGSEKAEKESKADGEADETGNETGYGSGSKTGYEVRRETGREPDRETDRETDSKADREPGILAWWGNIYPEFCFMGERNTQGKPRFRFWIAENLKKYLEAV